MKKGLGTLKSQRRRKGSVAGLEREPMLDTLPKKTAIQMFPGEKTSEKKPREGKLLRKKTMRQDHQLLTLPLFFCLILIGLDDGLGNCVSHSFV